jgi:sorting nexin-25
VGGPAVIHVAPYVEKKLKEEDFMRSLSEMAVVLLLPDTYSTSHLLTLLVREVLALAGEQLVLVSNIVCKTIIFLVLIPAVNMICDPDFINLKIIAYIHHQQKSRAKKRQLNNIESHEEMLKKIKDCDDLETLKHIRFDINFHIHVNVLTMHQILRYNIVKEILQVNVKFELAKEVSTEEKTDSTEVT